MLSLFLITIFALSYSMTIHIIRKKDMQYWLASYLREFHNIFSKRKIKQPIHILLCKVDHFEPGNGNADTEKQEYRVSAWLKQYPKMAKKHKDADGCPPKHTWFYPPHHDLKFLKDLVGLCAEGFGEIEMHLHHNRMEPFPDTEQTLRKKIRQCIDTYGNYGIFKTKDNKTTYAFIHGDWSLDNANGDKVCGINNEIEILQDTGCYADFTYPSLGKAQPKMINSIYYAVDHPGKPKSYNWGRKLIVGKKGQAGLLMIQGIIGLRLKRKKYRIMPSIEASNLDLADSPTEWRINYWIKNGVTIPGRPEWKFIKLHTHGAREDTWDSLFGPLADKMFTYFENKFNDGKKFVLHYVSAREMYNIAKAAEDGLKGDPNHYRDYKILPYKYIHKKIV